MRRNSYEAKGLDQAGLLDLQIDRVHSDQGLLVIENGQTYLIEIQSGWF
jgi:hypothetical protein